jgi:poly(A) polymerase
VWGDLKTVNDSLGTFFSPGDGDWMIGNNCAEKAQGGSISTSVTPKALSLLNTVNSLLADQGIRAYVVGGFVRDMLLGRDTVDIDIAVAANALEIASAVAGSLNGRYVPLDKENGIGRVVLVSEEEPSAKGRWELDFSTFEGSIEQDLARRDFTVDAMAIDLNELVTGFQDVQLVDPFGGRNDLERGVIRVVGESALVEDAVRLLRAVRLAAELGFNIDRGTENQIQRHSTLIKNVAAERVREELLRILAIPGDRELLPYLDKLGLLTAIMPELEQMKGVKQPREHFWDVFDHSLKTVVAVDFVLRQGAWQCADNEVFEAVHWSDKLAQHFDREVGGGSTRRLLLKLAALFHDIAKPQTKAIDTAGHMRFLGHGREGAAIAAGILERLRFSAREIKPVETIIEHHLRPMQMSHDELPSRRAIYRYFRDTGEAGIDTLYLSLADHLATRGPRLSLAAWREHNQMVEYVLARHFEQEKTTLPARLVDGHDLINMFGMSPGPELGELLEAVREAQAAGELNTRQEALDFVRDRLLTERK